MRAEMLKNLEEKMKYHEFEKHLFIPTYFPPDEEQSGDEDTSPSKAKKSKYKGLDHWYH